MAGDLLTEFLRATLAEFVGKLAPPERKSDFDALRPEELGRRNNWIDVAAQVLGAGAVAVTPIIIVNGWSRSLWLGGLFCGLPFAVMLAFVVAATIPGGARRFREFWRFHELKEGVSVKVLAAVYGSLAALGVVSAWRVLS